MGDVSTRLRPRDLATEACPDDGDVQVFDTPEALAINAARLDHLASLGLPLDRRRVLDAGCGIGHLAQFFVARGCDVVCVDGRAENIRALYRRYPRLVAHVANVEAAPLTELGAHEVVFAYGLLYHLENPLLALRNLAAVCDDLLLLETIVCDAIAPVVRLEDETLSVNQGLRGLGCRPSPSYVALALNRIGFPYVYAPVEPPAHPDYRFERRNDLSWQRDGANLRGIFVAARRRLANPRLVSCLEET